MTHLADPYRVAELPKEEPRPTFTDATEAEIAFWERTYCAFISGRDGFNPSSDLAVVYANDALTQRRKVFGRTPEQFSSWKETK
jgi:hypothetical protein